MKSGIYIITNKINGKHYIGQSVNIEKRWKEHARTPRNECPYLYNAIKKYGWDNFDKKILIVVDNKVDMNMYERLLIETFNTLLPNGYNCKDGGLAGNISEETRKKMSVAKKGKSLNLTEEQRKAKSESARGRKHSEETKQKLRDLNLGRKMPEYSKQFSEEYRSMMSDIKSGQIPWMSGKRHTEESKKKMSDARKGKKQSPEHKEAARLGRERSRIDKLRIKEKNDEINLSDICTKDDSNEQTLRTR